MTYIDPRCQIGAETIIYPFTSITGAAVIGRNCRIGPHALVHGPVASRRQHDHPGVRGRFASDLTCRSQTAD